MDIQQLTIKIYSDLLMTKVFLQAVFYDITIECRNQELLDVV